MATGVTIKQRMSYLDRRGPSFRGSPLVGRARRWRAAAWLGRAASGCVRARTGLSWRTGWPQAGCWLEGALRVRSVCRLRQVAAFEGRACATGSAAAAKTDWLAQRSVAAGTAAAASAGGARAPPPNCAAGQRALSLELLPLRCDALQPRPSVRVLSLSVNLQTGCSWKNNRLSTGDNEPLHGHSNTHALPCSWMQISLLIDIVADFFCLSGLEVLKISQLSWAYIGWKFWIYMHNAALQIDTPFENDLDELKFFCDALLSR